MPEKKDRLTRRDFLRYSLTAAVGPYLFNRPTFPRRWRPPSRQLLRRRLLGRTGAYVSMLGLGGQILLESEDRDAAERLINEAIDSGINYCDTAHDYYMSETYYGEVLRRRRQEVFLSTKTASRMYEAAWNDLQESLDRLQTDHVDLIQMHHLDTYAELQTALQPDGAIAALTEARNQGLTRFIGVTGHNIDNLIAAINAFDFDTVLTRINPLDPIRGDAIGRLIPLAQSRNMGMMAIKAMDRGNLLNDIYPPATFLRYTLSQPIATAVVGCGSVDDLRANLLTCRTFLPMSSMECEALEQYFCG